MHERLCPESLLGWERGRVGACNIVFIVLLMILCICVAVQLQRCLHGNFGGGVHGGVCLNGRGLKAVPGRRLVRFCIFVYNAGGVLLEVVS